MAGMEDRIRGALYGVAVGDALGAPLEFMSEESIRRHHGRVRDMIGGGWLNVAPGEVTDDTQMSLAVAGGIVENPEDPIEAIGERFVAWYNSSPKDIGGTCSCSISGAISLAKDKRRPTKSNWHHASLDTHNRMGGRSAGNGSLMRTAFCGLYYSKGCEAALHANDISRMTHYDRLAAADCQIYSLVLNRMTKENAIAERIQILINTIRETIGGRTRYPYDQLCSPFYKPNPTGYVVDSFATALHCIFTTCSFEDAVTKAVNLGGDADTIGAITGGLAGALYGYSSIPERWTVALDTDTRRIIDAFCDAAADARIGVYNNS